MRDLRVWWICLALLPWGAFGQAGPAGDTLKSAREAYSQGHYEEAESQYLNAEKQAESGGPNDARLAKILNNLGVLYQREAKYDEAEQALRRALDNLAEAGGPPTPRTRHHTQQSGVPLHVSKSIFGG